MEHHAHSHDSAFPFTRTANSLCIHPVGGTSPAAPEASCSQKTSEQPLQKGSILLRVCRQCLAEESTEVTLQSTNPWVTQCTGAVAFHLSKGSSTRDRHSCPPHAGQGREAVSHRAPQTCFIHVRVWPNDILVVC